MLGGTEKGGPKGRGRQYQPKHTPGQRRGHCFAGKISLFVSCLFTSRPLNALLPLLHLDTSPATAWSPFESQMRYTFLQEAVPHSLRDYMALCRVPKAPCTCLSLPYYVIITALVPCPSHPLQYKPLKAGSAWLSLTLCFNLTI